MKFEVMFLFFVIIFTIGCAAQQSTTQQPAAQQSNKNSYTWVDNRPGFAKECLRQDVQKTSTETYQDCMARNAAVILFADARQQVVISGEARVAFQSEEIRENCQQVKVVGMYQSHIFTKPKDGVFEKAEFAGLLYDFPQATWYINVSDKRNEILLIPEYTHPYQDFTITCIF
ncbi:MAG: hypothetical protein A3F54_02720 [Candidatus Kerfeldbacteria bacterium RIFCSPHIGHO2_12_FULL_48_17]|uniref:Uncharacterized protein n=1 Tax=Candidatus Kerfeldbacteria bacterium RIFCSPHIGHO2_12_FULL_48_17 TaxID=1798542 RepID=A0A1G2B225_9BACT|nr:MAG: hypothetical protein A3F54_02720 [Candidatus Kerfeldbacteria bacterium RIFCSPHIGHO2_12_FULL_48_17]